VDAKLDILTASSKKKIFFKTKIRRKSCSRDYSVWNGCFFNN